MERGCKKTGVRLIRVHDIRHSHASLLIEMGFTPLLISERLGHESAVITLGIYAHLLTPVMYEYRKSGTAVTVLDTDRPYDWNAKTVADILSREDYIGNTVNCRFTVPSYKDKRKMKRDPSEHIRFEHTHEPIIDMQI